MPFTPAHPALVLPFLRGRLLAATALVIGSMVPDFEYFIRMSVKGKHGHTLLGIFYFDIPVTIILSFLFHEIVKKNLINNSPFFLQQRFSVLLQYDFLEDFRKQWFQFLVFAGVGAFLHIFWDSFTHLNGFFVQQFPFLQHTIIPYQGARYPLFYFLQHASSVVGLTFISIYIVKMKVEPSVRYVSPNIFYWLVLVAVMSVVLFLRFNWAPRSLSLGNTVVSFITALCIALLVAGSIRFGTKVSEPH
jgi:hypothetical protein